MTKPSAGFFEPFAGKIRQHIYTDPNRVRYSFRIRRDGDRIIVDVAAIDTRRPRQTPRAACMTLLRRRPVRPADDIDSEHGKQRVSFERFLRDADGRFDRVGLCEEHRLIESGSVPYLLRRPHAQDPHGADRIVVASEHIGLLLNRPFGSEQELDPLPELQSFEQTLDFSVHGAGPHTPLDQRDAEPFLDRLLESCSELASVVGDEEAAWSVFTERLTQQSEDHGGSGRIGKDREGQEPSRESVYDRGDVEPQKQEIEGGEIQMVRVSRTGRTEDRVRGDRFPFFFLRRGGHSRFRRLLFAENPLYGAAGDLVSGAYEVHGNGAGAEFDLDTQLPKLVDGDAHAVRDPVPGDAVEEEADAFPEIPGSMPVPDGIVVKNEVMGGRAKGPIAKASYLEDLAAVAGGIVRTLLVRKPPAIAAKDGDFPPEQLGIEKRVVPFGNEAFDARCVAGHALAGQFIAASEMDGGFIQETAKPKRPGSGHQDLRGIDRDEGGIIEPTHPAGEGCVGTRSARASPRRRRLPSRRSTERMFRCVARAGR